MRFPGSLSQFISRSGGEFLQRILGAYHGKFKQCQLADVKELSRGYFPIHKFLN